MTMSHEALIGLTDATLRAVYTLDRDAATRDLGRTANAVHREIMRLLVPASDPDGEYAYVRAAVKNGSLTELASAATMGLVACNVVTALQGEAAVNEQASAN